MLKVQHARLLLRASPFSSAAAATSSEASVEKFTGNIPVDKFEKRYSLSSGPGGQNVQKNATKVEIRFKINEASWIPSHLRDPVKQRFANRINNMGEVVIDSDRTRERALNLADCFDKLRATIYDVERDLLKRTETEEDRAIMRKKEERAAQRRLEEKRRSATKRENRSSDFSL